MGEAEVEAGEEEEGEEVDVPPPLLSTLRRMLWWLVGRGLVAGRWGSVRASCGKSEERRVWKGEGRVRLVSFLVVVVLLLTEARGKERGLVTAAGACACVCACVDDLLGEAGGAAATAAVEGRRGEEGGEEGGKREEVPPSWFWSWGPLSCRS